MKIEEIRIPAPWGHIAAKAWGDEENDIVLLWHGLLDNAATHDNLIPLLPKNFYYVCVDLPGHGKSSNYDHPLPLTFIDHLLPQKIVCDYFQRDRYIFIAHSYSVIVSVLFTITYPKLVSKLVLLDLISPFPMYPQVFAEKFIHDTDLNNMARKRNNAQSYTFHECVQKVVDGRNHSELTQCDAEPLTRRMVKEVGVDKYVFTIDKRIGHVHTFDLNYILELLKLYPFQCPVLILITTDFAINHVLKSVYNCFKTRDNIKMHIVPGQHYVHMTNPERISGYITKFLKQNNEMLTKLWGDPINQPILVIHGVFDNAGAFDNLILHLPENYYYICIDLPSHGKSSQFPPFLPIHMVDFLSPVRIVMDYFKRDKYIFMGHSLGGQIMMFYAQLYPEKITKIILLDSLYLLPLNEDIFLDFTKDAVDRVFKLLEQEKRPKQIYTYEEAVQKLIDGREHDNMSWEAAEPIARRMFEEVSEGKYVMNIDHRLKERLYPSGSFSFMAKVHQKRPVALPVLILLSSQRCLWDLFGPLYDQYVKIGYEIHKYEGHHDMHATNPEVLAPFIVKFLLKHSNKL